MPKTCMLKLKGSRSPSVPSVALAVVILGSLGVTACAPSHSLSHRNVAGCYELAAGEWNSLEVSGDPTHVLPVLIRLDTAAASQGGKVLTPNIAYPATGFEFPGFPRWDIHGDTVTMIWSNGFSPTIVRLRKVETRLEGYAEAQRDIRPAGEFNWPRASVIGRPRKCRD